MLCLLKSHDMFGFIDGTLVSPKTSSHTHCQLWARSDALVKGWILGSLSDEILGYVLNALMENSHQETDADFSAKDVWDKLQTICGPSVNQQPELTTDGLVEPMEPKNATESKGLLQTHELYKYIMDNNVYPRECKLLKELRALTATHPWAVMSTSPDAGQLIEILLKLIGAKKTIEIGVFTGYSLLLTALAIPEDGKVVAIDVDQESYEIGLPVIQKAGVEHKINFIKSEGLPALVKLLEDPKNEGSFDYAFVDADKRNYINYHELVMKLLKVNGIVVYDNTLWFGTVAQPEDSVPEGYRKGRTTTVEFNKALAIDPRIDISTVPLGDGLTICRRLY